MTDINLGITGAKRATWRREDTRPLLQTLVENNPRLDDEELFELLWQEVINDEKQLRSIVRYWYDLALLALRRSAPRASGRRQSARAAATPSPEQRARTDKVKEQLKERVTQEAILLLKLPMPNGKELGRCTGADCRTFGGWFTALADKVSARQIVGNALSEKQVRRIWETHAVTK
jgi:hypothetical protein